MKKDSTKIGQLLELDRKIRKLSSTPIAKEVFNTTQQFEAVFYSNKLEGNKLTKDEALKAILK